MKNVQKIDLGLTGYDELFMNDAERKENKLPRIYDVPISEIDDFPDHPFKVKIDEDTGRGTASAVEWSGALASCRGAPISAGISKPACVRNTQAVSTVLHGSRNTTSGLTVLKRLHRE